MIHVRLQGCRFAPLPLDVQVCTFKGAAVVAINGAKRTLMGASLHQRSKDTPFNFSRYSEPHFLYILHLQR